MKDHIFSLVKKSISVALCLLLFASDSLHSQEAQDADARFSVRLRIPYCTVMANGKERTYTLRSTERPPRGLLKTKGKEHQQQLLFDFYEREDTVSSPRPLVITLFGGGFVLGSRVHEDVTAWCERFAAEGYLAASIDYRVMPPGKFSSKNLIRTGFMAAQDVSAAVRYFKANADKYQIDTNRIFLLGQSAGAVAIIHALYMDENQRPEETYEAPTLPPLHSTGTDSAMTRSFSVAGAVLLWGAIFNPDMMDEDETTPICMIHGTHDRILPVEEGHAFSMPHLPYVYGSQRMAERLQALGISSYELHVFNKKPHAFYFRDLYMFHLKQKEFDECFQMALDFMEKNSEK